MARRAGDNELIGLVETTLFMRWSSTRVRFWWTDFIRDHSLGLTFNVDGMDDAIAHAKHCRRRHPSWEITVWDIHDPGLPIAIDWNAWTNADEKFGHRNPAFTMKE